MPLFFDKSYITNGRQLQQSHRFVLRLKGIDAALIQTSGVPTYTIAVKEYEMLEYTFRYPDKLKWDGKLEFTIIEPLDEEILVSTLGYFMSKIYNSSFYSSPMGLGTGQRDIALSNDIYDARQKASNFFNNGIVGGYERRADEGSVLELSKQKLSAQLGNVQISTLDTNGNIYDAWRLNGAFITAITPTDLSYESEKISTIKVSLSYDWASYGFRGVFAEEDSVLRAYTL
jgi:hypothetical protein